MRNAIAATIVNLVLACATVLLLAACTLLHGNGSVSLVEGNRSAAVYHGKIKLDRQDADSHYALGCALQKRNRNRLAVQEFKHAVQYDPLHVKAYNALGVSSDALGDYTTAVVAYKAALSIDPHLDYVLNNLGYSYLLQGRFNLAIESFQKAVALDGDNPRYRNNLALAYARNGDYNAAFNVFKVGGDEAAAHLKVAKLYYREGLYKKAAAHFEMASALKPGDPETDKGFNAAASLARIHKDSDDRVNKTEAPPVQHTEKQTAPGNQTARYDNDGFYTIPAGRIEDLESADIDQTETASSNGDSSDETDSPIYTVSLARTADPAAESAAAKRELTLASLKVLDESQALERLRLEAPDVKDRPARRVKIEVSNGNGVRHMARRVGNYLKSKGFILMYLSNAGSFNHTETSIYYAKGYLKEAYRLSQDLPGLQRLEEVPEVRNGNAAISVLVGKDILDYSKLFERG